MTFGCAPMGAGEVLAHDDVKNLMLRLSKAMMVARNRRQGPEHDNPNIPAGYTYLGQMIAHDLAFSALPDMKFDQADAPGTAPVTGALAAASLDLGPLYGGGPVVSPQLYQKENMKQHRWRLSLAPMAQKRVKTLREVAKAATKAGLSGEAYKEAIEAKVALLNDPPALVQFPAATGDAMDLSRCPHMSGFTTAITADPRNDMHLIISQLTVLFAKFHNRLADWVRHGLVREAKLTNTKFDERILFRETRALVLAVYRQIVLGDFLARVLDPETYQGVRALFDLYENGPVPFPDASNGARDFVVSRAFATAAFRVGHVMARGDYSLSIERSGEADETGYIPKSKSSLTGMIDLTSRGNVKTAVRQNWDIEWDRFFFDGRDGNGQRTADGRLRNFSHLITPAAPTALVNAGQFSSRDEQKGGIVYLDLVRAFGDELDDADAVIPHLASGVPAEKRLSQTRRRELLKTHFTDDATGENLLSDGDIDRLAKDTSLYLYILLEAKDDPANGEHMGPVGSAIVAGTISHALLTTINDTESARHRWSDLHLPIDMPGTMPELLEFMNLPLPTIHKRKN